MKSLSILVIGTGMYTCGRGTDGYGTIIPALCEWKRKNSIDEIFLVGTNPQGFKETKKKISEIQHSMNVDFSMRYFPEGGRVDCECYKQAIKKIPKPACAIVVVPDYLHKEIAAYSIKGGLHTLVVKPLAPTLKEVRELIDIQKKHNVYCAVEFHKRLDEANLKLKDVINQGLIGDPLYFVVEYSQRKSIPSERFIQWVKMTNVFQYLGIHYVDIIYFVTKATPKRAMAIGQRGWLISKGIDAHDSIQGIIDWELPNGKKFSSHIITNWIDPENTSAMSDQKIKVIGTKGRFDSDQKNRGITMVSDEKGIEEPNLYFCSPYGVRGDIYYQGYGIESIQQFLNDVVQIEQGKLKIEDLEDKRPTFKQSVISTIVLEAVNKSLKEDGEWVKIEV